MKATVDTLYSEIKDYLNVGEFSPFRKSKLKELTNSILRLLYPKYYEVFEYTIELPTAVEVGFYVDLPDDVIVVAEVVLAAGSYYGDSTGLPPYNINGASYLAKELPSDFRLTDYWTEELPEKKRIHFATHGWYGTLKVRGEKVLQFGEEDEAIEIPATAPIIHYLASRYWERMGNRAAAGGDKNAMRTYESKATRELDLAYHWLERTKMARIIIRNQRSLSERKREGRHRQQMFNQLNHLD